MFLRDWQVVDFQGAHVRLDGFLDVGQRGILRFALGDAAGKAGALGDPETIFPAIDENLSHTFIIADSEGDRDPRWATPAIRRWLRPRRLQTAVRRKTARRAGCVAGTRPLRASICPCRGR